MGQENRRYRRFSVDVMQLTGRMMFASTVDIVDISLGGVSLHIDRALHIGTDYILHISSKDRSIPVRASVIWSTLKDSHKTAEGDIAPGYLVGMKFNDLATEKINDLVAFIESHKEEQDSVKLHCLSGLRVNMRFHLAANGEYQLTCPEDFSVKKISLGGMLIAAEQPLETEQLLPMQIYLPEDKEILFTGRIASCIEADGEGRTGYDIGIEFLNMPSDALDALAAFIRKSFLE